MVAGTSFTTVLVPGLIAVAINFQGIQAVALPLVQGFGFSKEIEDRVLAPVPVWMVGLEKIVVGAIQSTIAAIVVFPIVYLVRARGAAKMHIHEWLLFVAAVVFASSWPRHSACSSARRSTRGDNAALQRLRFIPSPARS